METENQQNLQKGHVLISASNRKISMFFDNQRFLLPTEVHVTETMFWKTNYLSLRPSAPRIEGHRSEITHTQISDEVLEEYQKWLDMGRMIKEAGVLPNRLPFDVRQRLHEKAREFLEGVPLPVRLRSVTFLDFGSIETKNPAYHSEKYIWPIGFK